MERFNGLEMYIGATIPVMLLLSAVFYMGYRKSCNLAALILTQLFAFFAIMFLLTLLGVYEIIPAVAMPAIYLVVMLVFYVGGATLTGILMEAKAREKMAEELQSKGER